ncbi:unnamed protein product [Colias eurytheme]|nr:unnamed protein product [Colias eurytheme]
MNTKLLANGCDGNEHANALPGCNRTLPQKLRPTFHIGTITASFCQELDKLIMKLFQGKHNEVTHKGPALPSLRLWEDNYIIVENTPLNF